MSNGVPAVVHLRAHIALVATWQARARARFLLWAFTHIARAFPAPDATSLIDIALTHIMPRLVVRGLSGRCLQSMAAD